MDNADLIKVTLEHQAKAMSKVKEFEAAGNMLPVEDKEVSTIWSERTGGSWNETLNIVLHEDYLDYQLSNHGAGGSSSRSIRSEPITAEQHQQLKTEKLKLEKYLEIQNQKRLEQERADSLKQKQEYEDNIIFQATANRKKSLVDVEQFEAAGNMLPVEDKKVSTIWSERTGGSWNETLNIVLHEDYLDYQLSNHGAGGSSSRSIRSEPITAEQHQQYKMEKLKSDKYEQIINMMANSKKRTR